MYSVGISDRWIDPNNPREREMRILLIPMNPNLFLEL
jgi:hypothetical protein